MNLCSLLAASDFDDFHQGMISDKITFSVPSQGGKDKHPILLTALALLPSQLHSEKHNSSKYTASLAEEKGLNLRTWKEIKTNVSNISSCCHYHVTDDNIMPLFAMQQTSHFQESHLLILVWTSIFLSVTTGPHRFNHMFISFCYGVCGFNHTFAFSLCTS